ncbi:cilia- and flagella-associated protein 99-like [Amphibalanus amphitrite]|uniref:cilia- and flagella-associated protein 99-like n=1 Tax=Amphibalanus amphitrite TaxID=1232801 RepID=UPI001C92786C|nr:cilia- and flagella-associated protein 99-like [Amphibalanus amphitrite]
MSERTNATSAKGKKGKGGASNAANSTKASIRPPQRITTVQKLHMKLLEAGIGAGDRRGPTDAAIAAGMRATARPGPGTEPPDGSVSRDSSPGIDLVPPPQEPPAEPPPPPPPKKPAKRTAAQIFRELARCRVEQEEELKRLSALEFVPVTEEVVNKKAVELEEKEAHDRAERRMLALLTLENSIASKEKALEHKKKLGDKALQEKRNLRTVLAELRAQEQTLAEHVRRTVVALRERAREAVSAVTQQKVTDARQFGEETLSLVREAQQQREEERQQRAQLIQEIRQLETTPLPRFKELDLTETAGHGLLDEMSIVELRERLALLNMRRTAELREKNQMILKKKKEQEQQMELAEEILARFHETQALERQQQRERSARRPPPVSSERLHQLQSELEMKRGERLRKAAERRAGLRPQRHLVVPTAAPPAAVVRSAPPGVGRTRAEEEAVYQRRTKSDSCVRLGASSQGVTTGTSQSYGCVAR